MLALIRRTLRSYLLTWIGFVTGTAALVWLYVIFYPTMAEEAETLQEAFANYPEGFLKAFGVDVNQLFISLEGFLAAEHYSLMWPIIAIIFVVALGTGAIAGEIESGTIEILLAQPISRVRIFLGKYISGLILFLSFTVASVYSVIPFALLHDVDLQLVNHFTIAVLCFLFGFAVFGITIMLSSIFSSKGKVAAISAVIVLGMYAMNLISTFKESVDKLKYFSFFYYFDGNKALIGNHLEWEAVAVFLVVGIVCSVIGLVAFGKRDVAT